MVNQKNILIVATSDIGGAGEGMIKFAYFLKELGHNVIVLLKERTRSDLISIKYESRQLRTARLITIIISKIGIFRKNKIVHDNKYCFYARDEISKNIDVGSLAELLNFKPDIVFSGWTSGFLNSTDLLNIKTYFGATIYLISTDMNHFTGGCHYAWDCKGYINGCDIDCPALLGSKYKDTAKINFDTKLNNVRIGDFQIISGSGWTLKQAKESKIYGGQKVFININSLIDTRVMNPKNRRFAKDIFGFDKEKFYVLMGCQNTNDPRKGFDYLVKSLSLLYNELRSDEIKRVRVVIVSMNLNDNFDDIPFEKVFLDFIKDNRMLSLLYQASDVFVNSSVEDSGPMMVTESLACGTPVVGFDMGVVHNMVITDFNGYKAVLKSPSDLAEGIKTIFSLTPEQYLLYSNNAVKQVEEYSSYDYAKRSLAHILL